MPRITHDPTVFAAAFQPEFTSNLASRHAAPHLHCQFQAQPPQRRHTNDEISEFCEINYGVTFPMFAKISVKGDDMDPLYREITTMPDPIGGDVPWNFQKYLIDEEGRLVMMVGAGTSPMDESVMNWIDGK